MAHIDRSASEIAHQVRGGRLSAVEVLDDAYARIAEVDGISGELDHGDITEQEKKEVHAFISLTKDQAYQQAEAVDRKVAEGVDPGLLAGVPLSVKDVFCVQDTLTTMASRILANFKSPYTATPVQRLIEQGAVVVGKANLDEFTYGSSSESSAFQPSPRNPWNTDHVPGGSSGGSTASVAAREVALSIGTDTGGSIRQPAAFSGVVGMKPTYGRVSRYGLIAFGSSLDCPGPIANTVRDAAAMLQVMAGHDPKDSTSSMRPVPDYLAALEGDIKGMRIGVSPDYFSIRIPDLTTGEIHAEPIQKEVKDAVYAAAQVLAQLGAEIVEDVPMPNTVHGIPAYFVISRVEAASNLHRFDGVKYGYSTKKQVKDLHELYRVNRAEAFGLQPKLRILMGMYVSAARHSAQYYQRALRVRSLIRGDFDAAFDPKGVYRLDALLTPTTPTTAFRMNEMYGNSVLMQYSDLLTVTANHAGLPGISIPAGFDEKGLPIGIQFMGSDFREDIILKLANAFEQATQQESWKNVKPQVLKDVED